MIAPKRLRDFYDHFLLAGDHCSTAQTAAIELLNTMELRGGRILDVGCGRGALPNLISRSKGCSAFGVDISSKALYEAKKEAKSEFTAFIVCSADNLPFKETVFDVSTCLEVLEHVYQPLKVLDEVYRVLKDEGFLIVSTPNYFNTQMLSGIIRWLNGQEFGVGGQPIDRYFSATKLLRLLLKAGFKVSSWKGLRLWWQWFPFRRLRLRLLRLLKSAGIDRFNDHRLFRFFGAQTLVLAHKHKN